jgi:hypothetical protein
MSIKITSQALLAALAMASASGCGGGGGGGSSSSESRTASAIESLDRSALAGSVTDAEFATRLDGILAAVDGREDGVFNLWRHYQEKVVGSDLVTQAAPPDRAAARTAQETIDAIKATEAYLMLEAFVTSVAQNLLIPDPVNTLLAFADKDVFLSTASVTIRAQIYEALVDGQITVEQAEVLYELGRQNPWKAKQALMNALSQTPPAWVDTVASGCLRDCGTSGDTTVYSGPFSKVFSISASGCTWKETLSGTIEVVVTGRGTASDPFEGTMDVTGSMAEVLTAGTYCQVGGPYVITGFDGTAFGNDGKLWGEGDGTIGTGTFRGALNGLTVGATSVTGTFEFEVYADTPVLITMPVTLRN